MKTIPFIDEGDAVRKILSHPGEPIDPPRIAPAGALRLWETTTGQSDDTLLAQPHI